VAAVDWAVVILGHSDVREYDALSFQLRRPVDDLLNPSPRTACCSSSQPQRPLPAPQSGALTWPLWLTAAVTPHRLGSVRAAFSHVARPHFLLRPTQIARRIAFEFEQGSDDRRTRLPWGSTITYCPSETIGLEIARRGLYDLPLCEALLRLADPGETAIDLGSNIGQMSCLLAAAVGGSGRVISYEPHPVVFRRLARNVAEWNSDPANARIELHNIALSNRDGRAKLGSANFALNQGSSSLESADLPDDADVHDVVVRRLDQLQTPKSAVGVMKVDIEGHEARALEGAEGLLDSGCIRDILFEEHRTPPTQATQLLKLYGYTVLGFDERLFGLTCLVDITTPAKRVDERTLLATLNPERAFERLGESGWAVYGIGPAARHRQRSQRYSTLSPSPLVGSARAYLRSTRQERSGRTSR
jgi:FkbM family methyltransferase